MKLLILILIFVSNTVHADLYKCIKDGKHSYQDHPCDGARNTARVSVSTIETMAGCYEANFSGWASRNIETSEIKSIGNGRFIQKNLGGQRIDSSGKSTTTSTFNKNEEGIPMKQASPEELQAISKAFGLNATEGISLEWKRDSPDYKPIGFYRGTDENGKSVILAYFFFSNGLAKKIPCPPGL